MTFSYNYQRLNSVLNNRFQEGVTITLVTRQVPATVATSKWNIMWLIFVLWVMWLKLKFICGASVVSLKQRTGHVKRTLGGGLLCVDSDYILQSLAVICSFVVCVLARPLFPLFLSGLRYLFIHRTHLLSVYFCILL